METLLKGEKGGTNNAKTTGRNLSQPWHSHPDTNHNNIKTMLFWRWPTLLWNTTARDCIPILCCDPQGTSPIESLWIVPLELWQVGVRVRILNQAFSKGLIHIKFFIIQKVWNACYRHLTGEKTEIDWLNDLPGVTQLKLVEQGVESSLAF